MNCTSSADVNNYMARMAIGQKRIQRYDVPCTFKGSIFTAMLRQR